MPNVARKINTASNVLKSFMNPRNITINVLLWVFCVSNIVGQTKPVTVNSNKGAVNKAKPYKSEIDKLAEKYSNSSKLLLNTSYGELEVESEIDFDANNKPQSVRISGRSNNMEAIVDLLTNEIAEKQKLGYKSIDNYIEPINSSLIKQTIFNKEQNVWNYKKQMTFFAVKYGCCQRQIVKTFSHGKEGTYETPDYWFSIEINDSIRIDRKGNPVRTTSHSYIQEKPKPSGVIKINLIKKDGVYMIPTLVNGIPMEFIFDTGASSVSISLTEAYFMLKGGKLTKKDVLGSEYFSDASGDISEGTKIILQEVKIGDRTLTNVEANVVHNLKAPLLLGLTALEKLGKVVFDMKSKTLHFE